MTLLYMCTTMNVLRQKRSVNKKGKCRKQCSYQIVQFVGLWSRLTFFIRKQTHWTNF